MQRQNETEIYHLPFDFEEATRAAKASNILCLAQSILEKVDLVRICNLLQLAGWKITAFDNSGVRARSNQFRIWKIPLPQ